MAASPLLVKAQSGSCGASAKKEAKRSGCPAATENCLKAECKGSCTYDKKSGCPAADEKCTKAERGAQKTCKKSK